MIHFSWYFCFGTQREAQKKDGQPDPFRLTILFLQKNF